MLSESYTNAFGHPHPNEFPTGSGGLAQSARGDQLLRARRGLIGIGLLLIALYGSMLYASLTVFGPQVMTDRANHLLEPVKQRAGTNSFLLPLLDRVAPVLGYAILVMPVALGCLLVLFGLIVHRLPLAMMIAGLVIFILFVVTQAIIEPASMLSMLHLKIICILGLAHAIRTASAYDRVARGLEVAPAPGVSRVARPAPGLWEPPFAGPVLSPLVGQTVSSRPVLSWFAILCVAAATVLAVVALVARDSRFAAGSLPLCVTGWTLLCLRPSQFSVRFTDSEICVRDPPQSVPYASIEGILTGGRFAVPRGEFSRQFVIQVIHARGVLELPAHLSVSSREICDFLFDRIAVRSTRPVHEALAGPLRRKQEKFGASAVYSFAARSYTGEPVIGRRGRAVSLSVFLAGLLALAWGPATASAEFWWIAGIATCVGSLCLWLSLWLVGSFEVARAKGGRASLVISPDGIMAVQGNLTGEVRWPEVLGIDFNLLPLTSRASLFSGAAYGVGGISLNVVGGRIHLIDVYDRPLALIYWHIYRAWRDYDESQRGEPLARKEDSPRPAIQSRDVPPSDDRPSGRA